jgi:hypothetical protein
VEILHTNIVLHDPRGRQPDGRPQIGDVARLASGRLVARVGFDFEDGTRSHAVRDYYPDVQPAAAPACVSPKNWGRWIDAELTQSDYRALGPRDYERERAELTRFRLEWPYVSARLEAAIGLDPSPVPRSLFELGLVRWANKAKAPISISDHTIPWRDLVERHAAGSFGINGQYDATPVTDEEAWTLSELPIAVANRVAIQRASGPILSRFILPDADVPPASREGTKRVVVDVVTVLAPKSGPRTLMTTAHVDVA